MKQENKNLVKYMQSFRIYYATCVMKLESKNLVHISALGVREGHISRYMQSKLEGEKIFKTFLSHQLF